jgi:Flp pilus assembly protein TadD
MTMTSCCRTTGSDSVDGLLHLGLSAAQEGRPAEACSLLDRAIERGLEMAPADVNLLNLGGMANFRAGNLRRAEDLLLRALEKASGHPGIRENVRLVQARLGKP